MLDFYNLKFACFGILHLLIYAPIIYTSAVDTNKLCNTQVNNASSSKSTHTREDSSFSNVQENPLAYCDGCVKVGNPCGHDQNFVCQRNAFRAQCQCINGFIEDKSGLLTCICPNTMVIKNGKCSCDNGYVRAYLIFHFSNI